MLDPWTLGLVAVVVLGIALIAYGALHDRARNRRAREEMLSPPKREIPQFRPDTPAPQYLSELQARRPPADATSTALTDADRAEITARLRDHATIAIDVGYASRSFVTDPASGWAVLDQPVVVVSASGITAIRELLPLLERSAMSSRPLLLAAPSIAGDVLSTLEVNVIQQKLRVLALTADKHTLATIAAHTGARPLERGDLQAGYFPADQLGRCDRWISDKRHSWLLAGTPQARTEAASE